MSNPTTPKARDSVVGAARRLLAEWDGPPGPDWYARWSDLRAALARLDALDSPAPASAAARGPTAEEAAEIREYAGLDAAAAATRSLGDDARTVCGTADHPVFVYPCILPAGHAGPHDNGSGDPWTSPATPRDR